MIVVVVRVYGSKVSLDKVNLRTSMIILTCSFHMSDIVVAANNSVSKKRIKKYIQ